MHFMMFMRKRFFDEDDYASSSSSSSSPSPSSSSSPSSAYTLWQNKQYPEARQHFLQSSDGEGCGSMLVEFHLTRGYSSELDLFIAQTVLQYLCLKKSIAD